MHGAIGKPKIQEELDGTIKIYSYDEWAAELKKREEEAKEAEKGLVEVEDVKSEVKELSLPDNPNEVEDKLNSNQNNG